MDNGDIWVGTKFNGTAKFDGRNWRVFNLSNTNLESNFIKTIWIENKDLVYFGTGGRGLTRYSHGDWYSSSLGQSPGIDNVNDLVIEEGNNDDIKWIGTMDGLVKIDNQFHYIRKNNSPLPNNDVNAVAIDRSGNKWLATGASFDENGGLARKDGSDWTVHDQDNSGLPGSGLESLLIGSDGNKWIGMADEGLVSYDGNNWKVTDPSGSEFPDQIVTSITLDAKGNQWFTTPSGLVKFDGNDWKVFNTENSGIPEGGYSDVTTDGKGNLWICTGSGVVKYDGSSMQVFDESNSDLPSNDVREVAVDEDGNKWIATRKGVAMFDGNDWVVYDGGNSNLASLNIVSIAVDQSNDVWITTVRSGLASYDGTEWEVNHGYRGAVPLSLTFDENGDIWVASNGGILKYDGDNWTEFNSTNSGFSAQTATSITMDDSTNLWIGTIKNGLIKYDGNTWQKFTPSNSGLSDLSINDVVIDDEGNKWIATGNGAVSVFRTSASGSSGIARKSINPDAVNIFPVPAGDQITVSINKDTDFKHFSLHNLSGQAVMKGALQKNGDHTMEVDQLPTGVYFLELVSDKGVVNKKVVVE